MKTPRDFVITGLQSWHMAMGGNIVNIAKELAKENRVLFINYAIDRLTYIRYPQSHSVKKYQESRSHPTLFIEEVSPGLWIYTPDVILESVSRIQPRWLFDFLNGINVRKFGKTVKKAIDYLGFNNYILVVDSDFYRSFGLLEAINPSLMVYYIRDNMIATDYFRYHGARMEEAMIRKAQVVIANSEYLADYAGKFNPNSCYVGQGCDLVLFDSSRNHEIPEEIQTIRKQFRILVGYVGALRCLRIDINLLEYIAETKPDWALILVGPEDESFRKSKLHRLANVFFPGSKKISELPDYIHGFDVAINPQVYNEVTRGNYPRKIDEYLAMGKPVVATETEAMAMFAGFCYLGRTPQEYVRLIEEAYANDTSESREKRIRLGKQHSWENNIREIYKAIDRVS